MGGTTQRVRSQGITIAVRGCRWQDKRRQQRYHQRDSTRAPVGSSDHVWLLGCNLGVHVNLGCTSIRAREEDRKGNRQQTFACMRMRVRVHAHTHAHTNNFTRTHAHMNAHTPTCTHQFDQVHACMHACMHLPSDTQTDLNRYTDRPSQIHRQTFIDTQTDHHKHRQHPQGS